MPFCFAVSKVLSAVIFLGFGVQVFLWCIYTFMNIIFHRVTHETRKT